MDAAATQQEGAILDLLQVTLCPWVHSKTTDKSWNQPSSSVPCEESENIERVLVSGVQSDFSAGRKFVRCRVNIMYM